MTYFVSLKVKPLSPHYLAAKQMSVNFLCCIFRLLFFFSDGLLRKKRTKIPISTIQA